MYSTNQHLDRMVFPNKKRKRRMTIPKGLLKIPKGLLGATGLILTQISTIYQTSKITKRKGEKLQLEIKNNLKIIKTDNLNNLKKIKRRIESMDKRANNNGD